MLAPRTPDPDIYPTERIVTERASIAAIAFTDEESEIRFYRVSPTDLHAVHNGETADLVYPVVEVVLDTDELVQFVYHLAQIVPK